MFNGGGSGDGNPSLHHLYPILRKKTLHPLGQRLDAEVLADSIAQITNMPVTYSSVIPEPFSYYKGRAAALPDGSITDKFLLIFGRPSRDSGAADERKSIITAEQRLYLFNSSALNNQLNNILRKKINEQLKAQIKDICPILIRGSLEEGKV